MRPRSPFIEEATGVEELPRVHSRLHHHVRATRTLLGVHDAPAVFDTGRHRHGTGHVLSGVENFNGLVRMFLDR